jgi:hypothetical protein
MRHQKRGAIQLLYEFIGTAISCTICVVYVVFFFYPDHRICESQSGGIILELML